jgi:hypothetical protein
VVRVSDRANIPLTPVWRACPLSASPRSPDRHSSKILGPDPELYISVPGGFPHNQHGRIDGTNRLNILHNLLECRTSTNNLHRTSLAGVLNSIGTALIYSSVRASILPRGGSGSDKTRIHAPVSWCDVDHLRPLVVPFHPE